MQISPCVSKGDNAAAFKHFNTRALAEMLCKHYTVKLRTNGLPVPANTGKGRVIQEVFYFNNLKFIERSEIPLLREKIRKIKKNRRLAD